MRLIQDASFDTSGKTLAEWHHRDEFGSSPRGVPRAFLLAVDGSPSPCPDGHDVQWDVVMGADRAVSIAKRPRARNHSFYEMGPYYSVGGKGGIGSRTKVSFLRTGYSVCRLLPRLRGSCLINRLAACQLTWSPTTAGGSFRVGQKQYWSGLIRRPLCLCSARCECRMVATMARTIGSAMLFASLMHLMKRNRV